VSVRALAVEGGGVAANAPLGLFLRERLSE
jgi:hypothetical protein